jgi:hypothetical protein
MSSKTMIALAALLAAGAASVPAAAAEQAETMVVVRDAHTGRLRNATPAEVKALRAQEVPRGITRPAPPGAVTVRENGTKTKHLGERGLVYSVVTRDAGGKLLVREVNGEDAANAALKAPAPATRQEHNHAER